jgi:ankyrin repeat protein
MRTYSEACFDAIVRDDIDDLSTFIKLGEINKFFDDQRNNLLIFAASVKNYNAVKWLLLNTDININHRNIYKATALHAAVLNHDVRTVRLLLAHDARVDLRDRNGMKARHYTIEMGYDDLAHLIPKK